MIEDPFVAHRSLLFTVAYEMLGSATDAEDVLQEAWLRWANVDHSQVIDPRAYLIRIVTRQALNQMRTLSRRREEYVGEWRAQAANRTLRVLAYVVFRHPSPVASPSIGPARVDRLAGRHGGRLERQRNSVRVGRQTEGASNSCHT